MKLKEALYWYKETQVRINKKPTARQNFAFVELKKGLICK
jgi:hypothetical protein